MTTCPICGCKVRRVNGSMRHYGARIACDRLRQALLLIDQLGRKRLAEVSALEDRVAVLESQRAPWLAS